ncbi:serine/threonine-protein kinase [Nitrospirillum sp. BR 11163]|uniref:serine/threonine-protein kinase n=1 Tax=Nitrospirillum sp. BR 11163 TaxID=3104323 RepID=UPI002AFDECC2|nr:serine/threonine-protein kinase [Nitrospirillum sp. BR 11163]MEA1675845.1 serine/threonine-protein kinase [Nitrospirillum sp. BR 11163]
MNAKADWPRIEAALDQLLDLPTSSRPAALLRLAGGDATVLAELRKLLDQATRDETWLDQPAAQAFLTDGPAIPYTSLGTGQRVGAYRILEPIGRGGMGEVYRAERADGHFEQQVALKLIRREAIDHIDRFQAERQILANLDHPTITRILDGGMHDGQPYMVMELVEGQPITAWCRDHKVGLDGRLALFLAVCDAVAYAHRNLIVHRDLKPGNVLVTPDGQVKLLDFGIAKRIVTGQEANPDTLLAPLTPGYAAPEQLMGGPVSTATDAYALGMLLYELLAGARPWTLEGMPLARAVRTALQEVPPPLSQFAARADGPPPVPVRKLAGDLDAIVAKALRKEPSQRYGTVDALARDVERTRDGLPISARSGSRRYVLGRFMKRHRLPLAAVGLLTLAILGGLGGVTWQYLRAQRAVTRAETIKAFVVSLFGATDAGFPTDRRRREVPAETLVDLGARRVEREFSQDPGLALELYGITRQLYQSLDDAESATRIAERRTDLGRKLYGEDAPVVIDSLFDEAWGAITAYDMDKARQVMATLDAMLHTSGRDDTAYRAQWWMAEAARLKGEPDSQTARRQALDQATALYERHAPDDPDYIRALQNAAILRMQAGDYAEAATLYQKALDHRLATDGAGGVGIATILVNQAVIFERLGRTGEAERNYERAAPLALAADGVGPSYWFALAQRAKLLHKLGRRAEALALYDTLLAQIRDNPTPESPRIRTTAAQVQLLYANSLTAEGRAADALPILERLRPIFESQPDDPRDMRRLRLALALAHANLGREDARVLLSQLLAENMAKEPNGQDAQDLRGQWGWYLLSQGNTAEAALIFDEAIRDETRLRPTSITPTLAWTGRARLMLRQGKAAEAAADVERAQAAYDGLRAAHDVRIHTSLLLTRSAVRLAGGDRAGAARDAATALADAQRTDAPGSPLIRQARDAMAAAGEESQPH